MLRSAIRNNLPLNSWICSEGDTVTHEQFEAIRDWFEAILDERLSKDTSDGGLTESIRRMELEKDARSLLCIDEE